MAVRRLDAFGAVFGILILLLTTKLYCALPSRHSTLRAEGGNEAQADMLNLSYSPQYSDFRQSGLFDQFRAACGVAM